MFEIGGQKPAAVGAGDVRCRPVFGVWGVVIHLARGPAGTEAHRLTESRRDRATLLAPRSREPRRCTFRTAWLARARSIRHVRRGERGRLVAAIPAVLGTSFGHDLIVEALSVLAALVLLTARPSRRFAAVGLAGSRLRFTLGTAT